jgi:general secretion pathway protein C
MRIRLPVAKLAAVVLFAALCAIVASWALQLLAPRAPMAPSGAVAQAQPPVDLSSASQLFGGAPPSSGAAPVAAPPSNIQVAGVLAAGPRGVALLAVDGKPARPYAVGESVADGMAVSSVSGDTVVLDRRGEAVRLPAPTRSSLDVLTSGTTAGRQPAGSSAPPPPAAMPQPMPLARPLPPAGAAALTPQQAVGTIQPPPGVMVPPVGVMAPVLNAVPLARPSGQ